MLERISRAQVRRQEVDFLLAGSSDAQYREIDEALCSVIAFAAAQGDGERRLALDGFQYAAELVAVAIAGREVRSGEHAVLVRNAEAGVPVVVDRLLHAS